LLLRAALLDRDEASLAWHSWRLTNVIDELDGGSYRLLPLLYRNLQRHGIADPDMERLKGIYRQTWYRNRIALHAARGVLQALAAAGIETMVLKGAPLAIETYAEPGVRPMNDIDIMVPAPSAQRAASVLQKAGFRARRYPRGLGRAQEIFHALGFANEGGVGIDLHWYLIEECRHPGADDLFWEESHPLEIGGVPTRALSPTDQLLHVCAHGSRWDPVPPIRWAADAHVLISRNAESIDWAHLVREARRRRLTLNIGGCMAYLREELDATVPEAVVEQLRRSRTSRLERWEYRELGDQNTLPWMIARYVTRYLRLSAGRPWWKQARDFPAYLQEMWDIESTWSLPADAVRRVMKHARQTGLHAPRNARSG
jgi:hypothetical protein